MAKWVRCQNCQGNGKVTVWDDRKRTYVTVTCPACGGSGKVNTGLV